MRTRDIEPKTTAISPDPFHPLEVEWHEHLRGTRKSNGDFTTRYVPEIALVHPGNAFATHRTHLIHLAPQTALNLLAWLEGERETLERLIQEERA